MRKFTWLLALAIPVTIISCQKDAVQAPTNEDGDLQSYTTTGNGAPAGAHYNLNIIGVENPKNFKVDEYTGYTTGEGRRMFVGLNSKTRIDLQEGSFDVLDADGTDGYARFQLPNPDPEASGTTTYSVFARVPGNQKGKATLTTCADGVVIEDVEYPVALDCDGITFQAGSKKFENVSAELLYVTILTEVWTDADGDGVKDAGEILKAGRYPLFDERLYGYFWEYDNQGLRILQLRFYWVPTEVDGVVAPDA